MMGANWKDRPACLLGLGLAAGLVIGMFLPHAPAHAVATDRFENFAVCTAPLDADAEALFFFDFTAGHLKAVVLNPYIGGFTNLYAREILADFSLGDVKQPRFLMVSGGYTTRRRPGIPQMGNSAVYICELSTGQVSAYSLPWNPAAAQNPPKVIIPIAKVGSITLREIVRPN